MNDENNILNQSEQSSCPSQDMLINFAAGKPDEADHAFMKKHLAGCEFCQDALEGYSLLADKNKIPFIIEELNQDIDKKVVSTIQSTSFFSSSYFRIAAILVVLVATVFILARVIKQPHEDIAKVESGNDVIENPGDNSNQDIKFNKTKPGKKQIAKAESIDQNNDDQEILTAEEFEDEAIEEVSEEDAKEAENGFIGEELNPASLYAPENKKAVSKNEIIAGKESSVSADEGFSFTNRKAAPKKTDKNLQQKGSYDIEGYSDMPVDSIAISIEFFIDGMNYYNSGDFKNSGLYLSNAFKWDETNLEAACLSGMSYYNLKNYTQAVRFFKEVASETDPCFYQAKYYKAQSFIKMNMLDEAESLLNELIATENPFQKEAKTLLDGMK